MNQKMIPEKVILKKVEKELLLHPNFDMVKSKSTDFTISKKERNMIDWQCADGGFEMGPGKQDWKIAERKPDVYKQQKEKKTLNILNRMKPMK